jgi:hypothetical protein
MRSICKKVPLKNTLYFRKYKKDKFLTERYIILLLHYYYLLSEICLFYISQNTTYFLTGLFCIHFFCKYPSIYFNIIIFGDIEVWDFKIFKILKVKRALVPLYTVLLVLVITSACSSRLVSGLGCLDTHIILTVNDLRAINLRLVYLNTRRTITCTESSERSHLFQWSMRKTVKYSYFYTVTTNNLSMFFKINVWPG